MKSSLKLLALLAGASITLNLAHAQQEDDWTGGGTGTATGQWVSGANWSLTNPPGNLDLALVGLTTTITLPAGVTAIDAFDLEKTGILLNAQPSTDFETNFMAVYNSGSVTLVLPTGSQFSVVADQAYVGVGLTDVFTSTATLTITGDQNGSGSFNFLGGLIVGAGGNDVVNQTAGTGTITGGLVLGADGGEGYFLQPANTGTGVYNISSTSTLTIDNLAIGVGSSSTAATSSGTFSMTGGTVTITDVAALGVSGNFPETPVNGNSGSIIQTGGSFTAPLLEVGESTGGFGTYALSGTGTLNATIMVLGDSTGASGAFTQTGGIGTATTLVVAESGSGTYNLNGGSFTVNSNMTVGDQTGSVGTVSQNNGTMNTAALTVGNDGTGAYTVSGGTLTDTGALGIGTGAGTGTFTLSGGTLNANGVVTLGNGVTTSAFNYDGGTLSSANGIAVLNGSVFNQGGANFDTATQGTVSLADGATYNLNSGTLTVSGDVTGGSGGIQATPNATFNFAGGTVATSGGTWADELGGSVIGNSTVDTTGGNVTLSGALTGSGQFTVTGGNTLDITGSASSSASWGINVINSSTVMANAGNFPSIGSIAIGAGSTVDMATSGTGLNPLGGQVSGAGAFNANFTATTDTLELTGPVSLTGVTTLNGGGTFEVLNGSLGDITDGGVGGNNVIVGAGTGSGVVSLKGNNTYTGLTTVDPNYTLYATNFTGAVTNNGTIGSYASSGSSNLAIGGSFISTGTVLVGMNAAVPSADTITVTGTVNVSGSTFTLVNPGGTGTFTILTAGTGTVTANNIVQPNSNLFLHAVVTDTINPDQLDLVTSSSTSAAIAGLVLTPNEQAVAHTLDGLILNPSSIPTSQVNVFYKLLDDIGRAGTSASQLAQNYEQLTPQSLQYAQAIAYEHSAFLVSKVDGFDNALHHEFSGFDTSAINVVAPGFDSGLGRQMQSMLAFDPPSFHQTAPNGVNYYPGGDSTPGSTTTESPSSPEPSSQVISDSPEAVQPMPLRTEPHTVTLRKPYSNFSVFIGGDGTIADLNQSQGASYAPSSKASYTSVDGIAGVSYRMTSNLAAGLLFDYSHTDADTDAYGSKTKVDSFSPGVFATYGDKGFYVNGLFAYGRNDYTNQRAIPAVDGIAHSSPNGNQYTGALDAGYDLHPAEGWTITPAGGLTYTHLDIDGFTETGADPANLTVQSQSDDSLRSRLGGYVTYEVHPGQLTLLPTLTAMWQHEFLDENAPITSQFNDFSSGAFTVHSVSMGRDSALIGIGLTAELNNSMAVFINCMADVNGDYNAENFVGGFKGSF
ncbi:MAG TPA: autotransporter domain-containing protein [Candidatus Methylacidiphilales bacterium]|nr:autotransporter domain-containing protein [Candidatus Methylacidiphilales bacterium]